MNAASKFHRLGPDAPDWVAGFVASGERYTGPSPCWRLVLDVFRELGTEIEGADPGVSGDDLPAVEAVLDRMVRGAGAAWRRIPAPNRVGDVGLFRIPGARWHVGIAVDRARMVHALERTGVAVEPWGSPIWAPRLHGWYRFRGASRLVARRTPFDGPRLDTVLPVGFSVREMLDACAVRISEGLVVAIDGVAVPFSEWARVRPKAGTLVTAAYLPGSGKTGRAVLMIAVVAAAIAAPYLAPAGYGLVTAAGGLTLTGSLVSAGVLIGGMLLVNALVPPTSGSFASGFGEAGASSPSVTGTQNQARPYMAIPTIFGTRRVSPDYGAAPYTEIVGDDEYLRMLFVVGFGPLAMEDIRIGETPLTSENFEGLQIETRDGRSDDAPMTIYPGTVGQDIYSILIDNASGWITRTSRANAEELSIDLAFPNGCAIIQNDGSKAQNSVDVEVEYAVAGSGVWQTINGNAGTSGSPSTWVEMDYLFRTPEAQYGGANVWNAALSWSTDGRFAGTKPAYLPAAGFSWQIHGWIWIYADGTYTFALDSSDAADMHVDGKVAADWYGTHDTLGTVAPDPTPGGAKHNYSLFLKKGFHTFRARVECRNPARASFAAMISGGIYPSGYVITTNMIGQHANAVNNRLDVAWFYTNGYASIVRTVEARTDAIRRSIAWAVPKAQYDIRVRRVNADTNSAQILDKVYLTTVRTITHSDPITRKGLAKIAVRIKATDQIQGVLNTLNVLASSVLPDWDSASGTWIERQTSSAAAAFRAVLQGPSARRPVADSRINLAELQEWAELAAAKGLEFNGVFDQSGTVYQRLAEIAGAARASFAIKNGKYGVVADKLQTTPVQVFTPRNSSSFRGRRMFPDPPHAIRVQFANRDKNFARDERIVPDDGYGVTGPDGVRRDAFGTVTANPEATRIETLEVSGCTEDAQAWKHGRYTLAVGRLRSELFELDADVEHLVCSRGDRVQVMNDVPLLGLKPLRVVQVFTNGGGDTTAIRVDEPCPMDLIHSYGVRIRLEDGAQIAREITAVAGEQTTLTFASPIVSGNPAPKVGDLGAFGELGIETRDAVVFSIQGAADLGARVTLIDYAPGVLSADTGSIPAFTSGINSLPPIQNAPEDPVIDRIQSDDYVLVRDTAGNLVPRMVIVLRPPGSSRPRATAAQLRSRVIPPGTPYGTGTVATGAAAVITAVGHGLNTGDLTDFVNSTTTPKIPDQLVVTKLTANTYSIPFTITGAGSVEWSKAFPSPFAWSPMLAIDGLKVSVLNVEEGSTYQIRLRTAIPETGATSGWVAATHTIIGKTLPPPDVQSFRVDQLSDGTRLFSWALGTIPPDVREVVIKYGPSGSTWGAMSLLQDASIDGASPFEATRPAAGTWRFAIKMRDTSRNESTNPVYTGDVVLGPPPQATLAKAYDFRKLGFPGVLANCFKNAAGALEATSSVTWATAPATWALWTADWNTSTLNIAYTSPVLDVGFLADFAADLAWLTQPNSDVFVIASFRYSEDNITWSAYEDVTASHGTSNTTRRARYFQAKLQVWPDIPGDLCAAISQFSLTLRAQTKTWTLNDLDTSTLDSVHRFGPGDIRIPVPIGLFSAITSVGLTFNGTGAGWTWENLDRSTSLGPHVRMYQGNTELADATIDVEIRGF